MSTLHELVWQIGVETLLLDFGSHRGRVGEPHPVYMMIALPLLGVCFLITRVMRLPRVLGGGTFSDYTCIESPACVFVGEVMM